jgi:hypothetical protein
MGIGVLSAVLSLSFGYYVGESVHETGDVSSSFASGFLLITVLATVINLALSYFVSSASAVLLLIYAGILLFGFVSAYGIVQFTEEQLGKKRVFKRGMDLFCTKLSWFAGWTYLLATFAVPVVSTLNGQIDAGIVTPEVLIASVTSVVFLVVIIFLLFKYWTE